MDVACIFAPRSIARGRIARVPLKRFSMPSPSAATIAFATSTSEAALPRAMECMEEFGVPRRIVAFVIPAGYSFNLDGSTLYLALASISWRKRPEFICLGGNKPSWSLH